MQTKKMISLLMACTLAFSACASQSASKATSVSAAAAPATVATEGQPFLISKEPLELTAHLHYKNAYVLSDEWTVEKKAAEMTNVSLKGTASPMETDSTQAFNLMIASKKIPDLVGGQRNEINKYGMEGAFVPLNDLIEEHAPNFKAFLQQNPQVKAALTAADGNIYQVPYVFDSRISEAWFIRQDWLDNLGLAVPTTVNELHDVLAAFVNEDANGNGKKDEIGLITKRGGANENKLESLLSLFGINDYWHINKAGKVAIGLYTPEYQQAVKSISAWYAEKLIDPEIFTRGTKSASELFPEDNGGVLHYWIASTANYNRTIPESVPGFKLVGMLPPVDSNGDQWEFAARDVLPGNGWAISNSNQHPVESMEYMDFWWSEEGRRLMVYGIEGDTYTMVDGKPQYTDKVLKASSAVNDVMRKMGGQIDDMGYLHNTQYELDTMHELGTKVYHEYEKAGVVDKINQKIPALSFTEEELDIITAKYPACRTYMLEQFQKWVMDGSNIDTEFAGYMEMLNSMGMDKIVEIYQTAYDRLQTKK